MKVEDHQKVTSLDYAILGLIQKVPLSGYQIRKEFETTALGNYSSSPGSIYPALKRLQRLDLISQIKSHETKKQKFIATASGRSLLHDWFLKPIEKKDITHNLNELLLRFGFMDDVLDTTQKIDFLRSLEGHVKKYLVELEEYHRSSEFQNNHLQGKLAFEYGLQSYRTTLRWCKKSMTILKNK